VSVHSHSYSLLGDQGEIQLGDLCQFRGRINSAKLNHNFLLIFLIAAKVDVMIQW